jgi:hypothetical protein
MTIVRAYKRVLRMRGELDAKLGKSIEAFYEISAARHTEAMRAEYEIGYRSFKKESKHGDVESNTQQS